MGLSCRCGGFHATLSADGLRAATHVTCQCADCRAAHLHFHQPDPAGEGVHVLQTTPDALTIISGADKLAVMRLSPKGLFRWYASCCNTPLFNTLASPKLPFAGIVADRFDDINALGPVVVRAHIPKQGGGYRHEHYARAGWGILSRMIAARLSGRWRHSPFFDIETGEPTGPVTVLTKEARAALSR
ncbi:hypothetical protein C6Y53_17785 [Pukyongiella litopenaei]|uniref:CENP-V/GFA domain-containing protein n=1 Tax=Pukyongiella litopenaei TaxID=2605946 RepID=A0A2S0MVE9_9RHOB|nr:hypothetical protein C6Y53_17785 [Pukyongiella litopenaei]